MKSLGDRALALQKEVVGRKEELTKLYEVLNATRAERDRQAAEIERLRSLVEQFLTETPDYEEMFVSELRDRVGDFREAAQADRSSRDA